MMKNIIMCIMIFSFILLASCVPDCDMCGQGGGSNEVGDLDLCNSCYKEAKAVMSFDD